jgi:hypothetical protein
MSWQPSTTLRFRRSDPSSRGVVRVVTDQGVGFLKAIGNPEREHVLACEWVGTHLARLLRLPTFEIALIEVSVHTVPSDFRTAEKSSPPEV